MFIIIAAIGKNNELGKNNNLVFHIKEDMKFFRSTTSGKVVVMGRKTLDSFPGGNPLKNRVNIVLAPDGVERDDCIIVHTLEQLSSELAKYNSEDVFVIGGAMFYKTMLPYCDEFLITKVDADGGAEVFYENLDKLPNLECVYVSEPVETNGYTIRFTTYKNNDVKKF